MTPSAPRNPMDGLSKEERRARALEMLNAKRAAKPTAVAKDAPAEANIEALKRELEERQRELEERARELERREREFAKAPGGSSAPADADATHESPAATEQALEGRGTRTRRTRARTEEPPTTSDRLDDTSETLALEPRPEPAKPTRPTPTGSLLDVASIDVHYGKIQALRGIDIRIQRGEVIALLGANGAGKSSTLRAISGMVAPSAGDIVFEGTSIAGLKAHQVVKYGIAHVPEGRELFPQLTVEENLRFGFWPLRKTGPKFSEALDRVYTMFPRLRERRSQAAGTMSGGEQQMLVFGRALMSSPKLLLVDEMSLGLAPLIVQILFDAIKTINAEGASVVIVEQFVHLALKNSDRAYVLAKGEVVLESPSSKLENDPNLLAAYLGGAEGHIEGEGDDSTTARKKPAKKAPAAKTGATSRAAANGRKPKK